MRTENQTNDEGGGLRYASFPCRPFQSKTFDDILSNLDLFIWFFHRHRHCLGWCWHTHSHILIHTTQGQAVPIDDNDNALWMLCVRVAHIEHTYPTYRREIGFFFFRVFCDCNDRAFVGHLLLGERHNVVHLILNNAPMATKRWISFVYYSSIRNMWKCCIRIEWIVADDNEPTMTSMDRCSRFALNYNPSDFE